VCARARACVCVCSHIIDGYAGRIVEEKREEKKKCPLITKLNEIY